MEIYNLPTKEFEMKHPHFETMMIEPEKEPDIVVYWYLKSGTNRGSFRQGTLSSYSEHRTTLSNLKLTFDGETLELKDAEILK